MGTCARPDASTRSSLNLEFCEISNRVGQLSGLRDYALRIRRDFTKSGDWGAIEAGGKERVRFRPDSERIGRCWRPVSQRRDVSQNSENCAHRTTAFPAAMPAAVVIALLVCRAHAVVRRDDVNCGRNKNSAAVSSKVCGLFRGVEGECGQRQNDRQLHQTNQR